MSDSELYSRLLLPKGHGYPLSHPQLFDDFPRRHGVEIGDVGVLTFDGSFDVFFNIRRHDDLVNRFGLPDGFEVVPLLPTDFASTASYHREGSHVSNKIIRVDLGAGNDVFIPGGTGTVVSITTSSKQTAILLLPDGASRTDLLFPNIFRDQALKHAESWYSFLLGLGHAIENGDLYLITGVDRSTSWSLATVDEHNEDNSISLSLEAAQVESAGGSYHWEWETGATFSDSGPRRPPGEQQDLKNQTVFLRGFKITLRPSLFKKLTQAVSIVDSELLSIPAEKDRPDLFLPSQSCSSSLGVNHAEHGGGTHNESFSTSDQQYHPANAVNNYLLTCSSDAVVAVTHDDQWASVLNENEEEIPEESEFIRRILAKYSVEIDAGGTYLKPLKMYTASKDNSEGTDGSLRFPGEKLLPYSDVANGGLGSQQTGNIGEMPYNCQRQSQKDELDGIDRANEVSQAINQGSVLGAGGNANGNHFSLPVNLEPQDGSSDPEVRNQLLDPVMKDHKLCPLPVSSFTGQRDILQKMQHYFDHDQGSVQRIFILHGLGGSGKSQIAFKFLHDSQAVHRFSEIFYIDASNEQTLEIDLQIITPVEVDKSSEASLHWLEGKQEEWLLLFDNADDTRLDLPKFLPCCTFGNILITTRNQELCLLASDEEAVSRVSNMEIEDAKALLLQVARQDSGDEQNKLAIPIVKELQCFPLAVAQAGGYIYNHDTTLSKYLKLYQSHRDKLLQHAEIQGQDHYGLAVYATWNLSYNKLSSAAQTLLQICSILHHNGISEQIFEKAAMSQQELEGADLPKEVTQLLTELGKRDGNWDSFVFHEVIGELESYSLMEQDRQDDSYTIHPLVQHWSGTTIRKNKHFMQKCVLTIIGLSVSWEHKDYTYRHRLLPHAIKTANSLDLEEISIFVATTIGLVYWEGGCWNDAEALQVVVMEKTKHVLGEDHPDTLSSMANLAATYRNLGRWNDAEAIEGVVMEKRKCVLGEEHPDTLSSMVNLAVTHQNLGHWNNAETLTDISHVD